MTSKAGPAVCGVKTPKKVFNYINDSAENVAGCHPVKSMRGASTLTLIVFGSLVGATLYCAYHILPFYYYYFELKNHMREAISVASVYNDGELRKKLLAQIKWMEIPAHPDSLVIERGVNTMRIALYYQEVFYITWRGQDYEIHTFEFEAEEEGPFEAGRKR